MTPLEDIGLTRAQIKVYVSLLEIGETTSGPLIKRTGLQNSVVYNALNQLIREGLVSFVLRGKRKHFSASDPKHLVSFIEDKKEGVEKLIPRLITKQREGRTKHESRMFLGWKGVYTAFNSILDVLPRGSEYIAFGAGFEEQYTEESKMFFREFQKKRARMKYRTRIIANETARKQVKAYKWYPKFGKPEFRFVPGFAPVGVIIFGDQVLQVAFEDVPVAVMITSQQIAESQRRSFQHMWEFAKK